MVNVGRVLLALALVSGVTGPAVAASRGARAALDDRLRASGRAEVTLRLSQPDPLGGSPRVVHATLALEPPDRARLEIPATGEKVTLRADGGEWLQPRSRQLLRLRPEHGALAMRWWRALLGSEPGWQERTLPDGRVRVRLPGDDASPADSADLWLDPRGLPARLELAGAAGGSYRLSGWRFLRPRGVAGFRLAAPSGWEAVELP